MNKYIRVSNIEYSYSKNNQVLKNISFSIKKREFVSIIGPSGCGKTTLLHLIGGLLAPDKGTIRIDKKHPSKALRNMYFSYVFQTPSLLPWKTVFENVNLPTRLKNQKNNKSDELIDLMGLNEFKNNYPYQLSVGQQQRVSLARAFSFSPEILIMDEPFSSLDEIKKEELQLELLKTWTVFKQTVLHVTHNLSDALFLSDKVIVLSDRPTTIIKVINVDFRRPRKPKILYSNKFLKLRKKIKKLLKDD